MTSQSERVSRSRPSRSLSTKLWGLPSTPMRRLDSTSISYYESLPKRSRGQNSRENIAAFKPYLGSVTDPIDVCVDTFLSSKAFELICVQAIQLSSELPSQPPPKYFVSFDQTPMHQWYQAFLLEFVSCFIHHLKLANRFPSITVLVGPTKNRYALQKDDQETFNIEANAHINAILRSFNINFSNRTLGSLANLVIDLKWPNSDIAMIALQEATSPAGRPPIANWKIGQPLISEHRRRLIMFDISVTRLLAESTSNRWVLTVPNRLQRGVTAYKEHYLKHLREEFLSTWKEQKGRFLDSDDVFM